MIGSTSCPSLLILACAAALAMPARAEQGAAADQGVSARDQLRRDRQALQTRQEREESACRRKFWVNSCLEDVRRRARHDREELDRTERALEQQVRQQREQAAAERVRDKQTALSERLPPVQRPLTDAQVQERVQQAQEDRDRQAQDRLQRREQRQAASDQRQKERLRAVDDRQPRGQRALSADPAAAAPGLTSAPPQSRP